jgi:hypothetical protein
MNTKLLNPGKLTLRLVSFLTGTSNMKNMEKPIREILNKECVMQRYKKINLDIFTRGIHCIAKTVSMYYRVINGEHIIVLDTQIGRLVGRNFDSLHADEEYSFICEENKIESEGKDVNVNLFNYDLYDKDLNESTAAV